ncbi:hypothetical protein AVEN_131145-1 [Araneus ventricosus]|uniref:Uncharacterized protein n=1 Tax=Araneus ventricosus TaxID=182803 RepID=A0A4Y2HCF2_ARAVE|nr:hypothetical protein AVEN_131145-1 [Araneus ventricosus]
MYPATLGHTEVQTLESMACIVRPRTSKLIGAGTTTGSFPGMEVSYWELSQSILNWKSHSIEFSLFEARPTTKRWHGFHIISRLYSSASGQVLILLKSTALL